MQTKQQQFKRFIFAILMASLPSVLSGQEFRAVPAATPLPPASPQRMTVQLATPNGGVDTFTFESGPVGASTYYTMAMPAFGSNVQLMDMLSAPHIQKQIEFSKEQKQMLGDFQRRLNVEYSAIRDKFPELKNKELPKDERRKLNRSVHLKYQEVKAKINKEFEDNLVPQQLKMIDQIKFNQSVQMFGLTYTLTQGMAKKEMKVTPSQKKEMEKIKMESERAIQKKIAEMRNEAKKQMLKVLDKQQRDTLKELEGSKGTNQSTRL